MYVAMLLLLGAKLVVDPGGISNLRQTAVIGIRNFERNLQARAPWKLRSRHGLDLDPSPAQRASLRIAGVVLIGLAMTIVAVS